MADNAFSRAIAVPHDEGLPNIVQGSEDWNSAAIQMAESLATDSTSYIRSSDELAFTNHDGTNDTVDVTGGIAYIRLEGVTIGYQTDQGGKTPPAYDEDIPSPPILTIMVPDGVATGLSLTSATANDVWLAYATDANVTGIDIGDVYFRHGSGLSAPPHPSVKIGTVNPDNASADVLTNRYSRSAAAATFFEELQAAPSDSEYETSQIAVYARSGNVYAKPNGGSEVQLDGGGSTSNDTQVIGSTPLGASGSGQDELEWPIGLEDGESVQLEYVFLAFDQGGTDSNITARLRDMSGTVVSSLSLTSDPIKDESFTSTVTNGSGSLGYVVVDLVNTGSTEYFNNDILYDIRWSRT